VRLFDMTDRDACRQALTGCFADLIILCAGLRIPRSRGGGCRPRGAGDGTNFLGPVNCLALQTQLEAGDRVVLVSSMAHWLPFPAPKPMARQKRR
jgi:hypothetical protein